MWLTKLWWLFDSLLFFARFRFLSFLFGEVLFFAELLDVYSYYVFDTPTLFACLVTSVDEELRCFFYWCLWWQGNSVTLLTQVHIPVQSFKWRLRGKKKLNGWQFSLQLDGKLAFVAFVGIWWIRDSSSPSFSSRGLGCRFFFSEFCLL